MGAANDTVMRPASSLLAAGLDLAWSQPGLLYPDQLDEGDERDEEDYEQEDRHRGALRGYGA